MDDNVYNVTIPNYMVNKGVINTITISVRSKSIDVCSTSVSPWNVSDNVSLESDYMGRDLEYAWKLAKQSSGVYAIDTNGFPVPSEEALDDSYSGVAFTVNGKAYQVAKVDAFGSDGTKIVYWWKNNYEDLVELPNYTKVNNANINGFLPLPDGSNTGTVDNNYQEWINLTENVAALSDFKGQQNTSLLVEYLGAMDNTIGRAVVDFRNNEDINEGYDDWFIPSCGQMGCMAILSDKIDNLLTKIPGAETLCREDQTDYWSSTEGSRTTAWYVGLFDGGVGQHLKNNERSKRCRLIRELRVVLQY